MACLLRNEMGLPKYFGIAVGFSRRMMDLHHISRQKPTCVGFWRKAHSVRRPLPKGNGNTNKTDRSR